MQSPAVLVFPADIDSAQAFSDTAASLGLRVIRASSEHSTVARTQATFLPYVTSKEFDAAFVALMQRERISLVYAPHQAVWGYLKSKDFSIQYEVCNEAPSVAVCLPYREAQAWAAGCAETAPLASPTMAAPLTDIAYAALYRGYKQIPGQSDDMKIWLLTQIFRHAPKGDVVEIGAAYGRSAFALGYLAKAHDTGTVVAVDPWQMAPASNQGKSAELVNKQISRHDWDMVFRMFLTSVHPLGTVNYIRDLSENAAGKYLAAGRSLSTPELGETAIEGRISILHIDGNHAYQAVQSDLACWGRHVVPGGWILLDDYVWAFGDGPQRVGDEFLEQNAVETAFCAGDTLCIQTKIVSH